MNRKRFQIKKVNLISTGNSIQLINSSSFLTVALMRVWAELIAVFEFTAVLRQTILGVIPLYEKTLMADYLYYTNTSFRRHWTIGYRGRNLPSSCLKLVGIQTTRSHFEYNLCIFPAQCILHSIINAWSYWPMFVSVFIGLDYQGTRYEMKAFCLLNGVLWIIVTVILPYKLIILL